MPIINGKYVNPALMTNDQRKQLFNRADQLARDRSADTLARTNSQQINTETEVIRPTAIDTAAAPKPSVPGSIPLPNRGPGPTGRDMFRTPEPPAAKTIYGNPPAPQAAGAPTPAPTPPNQGPSAVDNYKKAEDEARSLAASGKIPASFADQPTTSSTPSPPPSPSFINALDNIPGLGFASAGLRAASTALQSTKPLDLINIAKKSEPAVKNYGGDEEFNKRMTNVWNMIGQTRSSTILEAIKRVKTKVFLVTGAFNPYTHGHEEVARKAAEHAASSGYSHFYHGLGASENVSDAPLSFNQKEKIVEGSHQHIAKNMPQQLKGKLSFGIIPQKSSISPFHQLTHLVETQGHKNITIALGPDQMNPQDGKPALRQQIESHIKKHGGLLGSDMKTVHLVNIDFHSLAEKRNEEKLSIDQQRKLIQDGKIPVEHAKAGRMREAVLAGADDVAYAHMPESIRSSGMEADYANMLRKQFEEVVPANEERLRKERNEKAKKNRKKKMKKESVETESDDLWEEVSAVTRMKLAKAAKRTASRRKIVRRARAKRRRNLGQLKIRAKNEIISQLRQKFTGKRNWKKIPYTQRAQVDRNLARRKKLVNNMVKRIMPQVMKGENERLKRLNNSFHPIVSNFLLEASRTTGKKVKRQPVDSAQKAKRKRQNTNNQRNTRAKHDEAKKSGNVQGRVYVVKNKRGEVEIVDKKSLRKDHQVIVDSEKASIPEIKKYLNDKAFSNTKTSIELFGYQQDAGGEKKPKKEKKEGKAKEGKKKAAPASFEPPPQMIPAVKKASKKDTYASSHDATSMETGIAFAVNSALGLKPEEMVSRGLIAAEDVKAVMSNPNESFMPSCQRAAQQLMKQFPGAFIKHTGRMRKTTKLSQDAIDNGVRDNTPKSDLVLVDKDGNVIAGFSQKIGDSQLSSGGPAETVTNLKFAMTTVGDKMQPSTKKEIEKFIKFFKNELAGNPRTRQGPVDLYKTGGEREGEDKEVRRREELHGKATDMLNKVLNGDKKFAAAFIYALVTGAGKFKEGDPAIATHIMSANRDGTDLKVTEVNLKYAEKLIDKVKFQMKFKSSAVETTDVKKKWQEFKERKKKLGQKIKLSEDFRAYSFRSVIRAFLKESFNILSGSHLVNVLLETSMSLKDATPQEPRSEEEAIQYLEDAFEYIGDDYFKLYQFFEDSIDFDTNSPVIDWPLLADPMVSNYNTIYVNGKPFQVPVETPIDYTPNGSIEYPLSEEYLEEKKKRNYRQEYDRYHARPEQRKNRSKRVLARRLMMKLGRVRKGDGKDVDHKDGNPKNNGKHNLRVRDKSENRADND